MAASFQNYAHMYNYGMLSITLNAAVGHSDIVSLRPDKLSTVFSLTYADSCCMFMNMTKEV